MATKKAQSKSNLVELELEDAQTGDKKKVKVSIADGFPYCRPLGGQQIIVKSDDLMKLATGQKLDDEVKKSFDQLGFGKAKAIAFLEKLAISGSAMAKIEE